MSNLPQPSRTSFILSIWVELQSHASPIWRGYLETTTGRRAYFDSLAELNHLLHSLGGWRDAPAPSTDASASK